MSDEPEQQRQLASLRERLQELFQVAHEDAASSAEPVSLEATALDKDAAAIADEDHLSTNPLVIAERKSYENDRLKIENQHLTQALTEATDLHALRKKYIPRLFLLIIFWLAFVLLFVILTALPIDFTLSDKVLIAFITSTTVSVLGLFIIAAKWLFPPPAPRPPRKQDLFTISRTEKD